MQALDLSQPQPGQAPDGPSPIEILKARAGRLGELPALSGPATRALDAANHPSNSLGQFIGAIEADPQLAAGLLRLANSAPFRVGRAIGSVDQAVARLGLRECKTFVLTLGIRELFHCAGARPPGEPLWQHSFLTACLCRRLNRSLEFGYQGEEFLCGLAHDLGRLLLAIAAPDLFAAVDPLDFDEGQDRIARERLGLGTDHCAIGEWYAAESRLPASAASAIQFHHTPARVACHRNLVGLTAMADHMANHWQRHGNAAGYALSGNPGWAVLAPKCDEGLREKLTTLAPILVAETAAEAREAVAALSR